MFREGTRPGVVALSSGFMTYPSDAHPDYGRLRRELEECAQTLVLLPSLNRECCVAEITFAANSREDSGSGRYPGAGRPRLKCRAP